MKNDLKLKAIQLRKKGFSMEEIHRKLKISKSTASLWSRNVVLNSTAVARIEKLGNAGRKKGEMVRRNKREKLILEIIQNHQKGLKRLPKSIFLNKLFCSLLYWCEGEKRNSSVVFVNSDPILVETFLRLLRSAFSLDERKFRVVLHLHPYHKENKQKKFWSTITKISVNQFNKVYWKNNGGKNLNPNYPGCVSIRYHDHLVEKELQQLWKLFGKMGA